jgi:hypothetical protein
MTARNYLFSTRPDPHEAIRHSVPHSASTAGECGRGGRTDRSSTAAEAVRACAMSHPAGARTHDPGIMRCSGRHSDPHDHLGFASCAAALLLAFYGCRRPETALPWASCGHGVGTADRRTGRGKGATGLRRSCRAQCACVRPAGPADIGSSSAGRAPTPLRVVRALRRGRGAGSPWAAARSRPRSVVVVAAEAPRA